LEYLQKRRERINERLRTLQNLVPNGTKVDISTMLEEAVHYVKFLQLQIKVNEILQDMIRLKNASKAQINRPDQNYCP